MYSLRNLDNPVWQSLTSVDSRLNIGNNRITYLHADISPFVGLAEWTNEMQIKLYKHVPLDRSWSVMIAQPIVFNELWERTFSINLFQMVCRKLAPFTIHDIDCRILNKESIPAMLALTKLTRPGPFTERTIEFGEYQGIFEDNKLVAMAGERLHLDRYTELSAVCTHPDYTGRGYAAYLVSQIATKIYHTGKIPFLHVRFDNERAIKMYQRLGFETRSEMYFAVINPLPI